MLQKETEIRELEQKITTQRERLSFLRGRQRYLAQAVRRSQWQAKRRALPQLFKPGGPTQIDSKQLPAVRPCDTLKIKIHQLSRELTKARLSLFCKRAQLRLIGDRAQPDPDLTPSVLLATWLQFSGWLVALSLVMGGLSALRTGDGIGGFIAIVVVISLAYLPTALVGAIWGFVENYHRPLVDQMMPRSIFDFGIIYGFRQLLCASGHVGASIYACLMCGCLACWGGLATATMLSAINVVFVALLANTVISISTVIIYGLSVALRSLFGKLRRA